MGRPVQHRNGQNQRRYYDHPNGGRPYHGRSAPYEVGQSHRYLPGYDGRDPYFSQFDVPPQRRGGYRDNRGPAGIRGGRDMARPGYYPAARHPTHPDHLMNDLPA